VGSGRPHLKDGTLGKMRKGKRKKLLSSFRRGLLYRLATTVLPNKGKTKGEKKEKKSRRKVLQILSKRSVCRKNKKGERPKGVYYGSCKVRD